MEPIARNFIRVLQDQGFVSNADLVDGSSVFLMGRQRNRFFVFKQLNKRSFFIKQAHEGEAGTQQSVTQEAAIYNAVQTHPDFAHLRAWMPEMLHFDPQTTSITFELLQDAEDVGTRARKSGSIDKTHAAMMGQIAADFHHVSLSSVEGLGIAFEANPHWILRLEDDPSPLASLRGRSPASAHFIDQIRADDQIKTTLATCRASYSCSALIHGDLKCENFLITPKEPVPSLRLIDWERADIGDPCWDVGWGIAAFILHQAMQAPTPAPQFDWNTAGAAIAPFWLAYSAAAHQQTDMSKSIDMIAARLLVAGYEYCFAQDTLPELSETLIGLARALAKPAIRQHLIAILSQRAQVAA